MSEAFELNYTDFIENIINQVDKTISDDLNVFEKKYVKNSIKNYTTIAAKYCLQSGIYKDESIFELTRLIAKWTYHKCIDLMKSTVPQNYWDSILLKINFTIFEFYKAAKINEYSSQRLYSLIEEEVNLCYNDCINELKNRKLIDEETFATAIMQSNVDDFLSEKECLKEKLFRYLKQLFSILVICCGGFICFMNADLSINEIFFTISIIALGCYMLYRNEVVSQGFYLYTIFSALTAILISSQFIDNEILSELLKLLISVYSVGNIVGYRFGEKKTELL